MATAADVAVAVVAGLHVWFMILEMVLWTTPLGQRTFRRTAAEQLATRAIALNQGLYNGFLAAGLGWSLVATPALATPLACFFLGCVFVAGVVGAATAARAILWAQAVPGAVALALTLAA
ncbi:MAG: DUF1304 domain-containing protein [Kofleriaceae bacterium]